MKIPALAASLLVATAMLLRAEPTPPASPESTPPSLSLPKAAAIAQTHLESLELPPEFYLRGIHYQPPSDKEPEGCYLASFEPSKNTPPQRIQRIGSASDPAPTEPVIIKSIKVLMDGTATVIEQEMPSTVRRIIRPAPVDMP
jgi:hypothetical protein